jgi:hypothetical protein
MVMDCLRAGKTESVDLRCAFPYNQCRVDQDLVSVGPHRHDQQVIHAKLGD